MGFGARALCTRLFTSDVRLDAFVLAKRFDRCRVRPVDAGSIRCGLTREMGHPKFLHEQMDMAESRDVTENRSIILSICGQGCVATSRRFLSAFISGFNGFSWVSMGVRGCHSATFENPLKTIKSHERTTRRPL